MQRPANPNGKLATIFGGIGALGLLVGIVGLLQDGDTWIAIGIVGVIVALTGGIAAPMLFVTGRKQIAEIEALVSGHDLRVHWTFDPDEWGRYTENEYARGMKQTRSVTLWTFIITFGLMLIVGFFSGAITAATLLLALLIGVGLSALLGGSSYLMTRSAYAVNRAGVGEVYIGSTSIYFGTRFHTWKSAFAQLEKVALEPGDPSVVQFNYKYGSGDNTSHLEVRIPVPRGREAEAEVLVNGYYAAS